jgi:DHA1 family bicyclomycin/chloramphenicol resistance-like MFS transporter
MPSSLSSRFPSWLLIIGAMTAVGPVSIDMYLPGFTAIERELGEGGVERTMSAYMLGIAIGQFFYGPLSDRFGRKPPLYIGFLLYALGSVGCALASSMTMLMAGRVLQALGGCAGMVIGRAIVRDRCEPQEAARAFSTLMLIVSLGPLVAPIAGGFVVTALGWRAVFWFQVVFALVLMVAMHLIVAETRNPESIRPLSVGSAMRDYGELLGDRRFMAFCLIGSFSISALLTYVTGAPTVLSPHYGLSAIEFSFLIGLNGIAFMAASRLNMRSLETSHPGAVLAKAIHFPPMIGLVLVLAGVYVGTPLWVIVSLQLLFFVSVGRVGPNVSALALAEYGANAGTASAMIGIAQSVAGALAAFAVAQLNDGTIARLGLLMLANVVIAWLWYASVRPLNRAVPPRS